MANWLYISDSQDGWRNLAADEYFLDHLSPQDMLLYFYVNANAVIIGRGQNPWAECNLGAMQADGVQLVRRITGGGAVFHDVGNLNFSFIAGEGIYDVRRQLDMILSALRALGIPCDFSGRNDLLCDGRKFSGNAFCARGGLRQHHGTLLVDADLTRLQNYLNVDPRKLQAKGVKSVRSRVCNLKEYCPELTVEKLRFALQDAFRLHYGEYVELPHLDDAEIAPYLEKQAGDAWRLGATPRFDVEIENRFAWGNMQLLLTLRQGRVAEAHAYSDAIDADLPGEIERSLPGAAYVPAEIANRLAGTGKPEAQEFAEYVRKLEF